MDEFPFYRDTRHEFIPDGYRGAVFGRYSRDLGVSHLADIVNMNEPRGYKWPRFYQQPEGELYVTFRAIAGAQTFPDETGERALALAIVQLDADVRQVGEPHPRGEAKCIAQAEDTPSSTIEKSEWDADVAFGPDGEIGLAVQMYGEKGSGIDIRAVVWATYDGTNDKWTRLDGTEIDLPFTAFVDDTNATKADRVATGNDFAPFISAAHMGTDVLVMVADRLANDGNRVLKRGTIGSSAGFQATGHDLGPISAATLLADNEENLTFVSADGTLRRFTMEDDAVYTHNTGWPKLHMDRNYNRLTGNYLG
eukprot:Polyplicarium_translucidae@DN3384_c2_g1_i3.p1